MVNNNAFPEKLKSLRKEKGYTQQDIADACGVTRATIGGWETGRRNPQLPALQRVAKFLGVGLDYFGYATTDDVTDLIKRAKDVFESDAVSDGEKEQLYLSLMSMYLELKKQTENTKGI